jgi:hypothetical protein
LSSCNRTGQGVEANEEKYRPSGHRGRLYYLPVLFQSFDGGILSALASVKRMAWLGQSEMSRSNGEVRHDSFGNIMLIARQRANATNVSGLRTWNSLGRFVKRGEKGIFILAPMVGRRRTNGVATDEPGEAEGQRTLYGFRAVYVFDGLSRNLWPSLCALDRIRERLLQSPLDSNQTSSHDSFTCVALS